jgi:hypothetical protein
MVGIRTYFSKVRLKVRVGAVLRVPVAKSHVVSPISHNGS